MIGYYHQALSDFKAFDNALREVVAVMNKYEETMQGLAVMFDRKAQTRLRNGHPPLPRKQLLHNGRKP